MKLVPKIIKKPDSRIGKYGSGTISITSSPDDTMDVYEEIVREMTGLGDDCIISSYEVTYVYRHYAVNKTGPGTSRNLEPMLSVHYTKVNEKQEGKYAHPGYMASIPRDEYIKIRNRILGLEQLGL